MHHQSSKWVILKCVQCTQCVQQQRTCAFSEYFCAYSVEYKCCNQQQHFLNGNRLDIHTIIGRTKSRRIAAEHHRYLKIAAEYIWITSSLIYNSLFTEQVTVHIPSSVILCAPQCTLLTLDCTACRPCKSSHTDETRVVRHIKHIRMFDVSRS